MEIKIKSNHEFNELVYDAAYGISKMMIIKDKPKAIKRVHGFILTASKTSNSVIIKIHKE